MLVIVDLLLDAGTEVKPPNVQMAAKHWRECLQLLVSSGDVVYGQDEYGGTALITAMLGNHTECVDFLVRAGADVNERNRDGDTTLTLALSSNLHGDIYDIV